MKEFSNCIIFSNFSRSTAKNILRTLFLLNFTWIRKLLNLPLKLDLNNLGVEEPEDGPLLEAISASIKSRTSLSFAKTISTNCLFSRKKFDTRYFLISLPQIRLVSKMYQFLHRARALNFNYRQTHIDSYSECQMKIKIIGQKLPNSKVTDSKSSLKIPSIFFGESQIIAIFSILLPFLFDIHCTFHHSL